MELLDNMREYTYDDYITWPEDEHWEIIDGIAYPTYGSTALASPTSKHQQIISYLHGHLFSFLEGKPCKAYISPMDVRLDASKKRYVVQPDVFVLCDKTKDKGKYIEGAPDMIIEVQSPRTTKKDFIDKMNAYKKHGVKEYWIVMQDEISIIQMNLVDGEYIAKEIKSGMVESTALNGFSFDLDGLIKYIAE